MFTYPYQTTALVGTYDRAIQKVISQLMRAASNQELLPVTDRAGEPIKGLYEVPGLLKDIAPFNHPVAFESFGRHYVVIDTRPFHRYTPVGERVISNQAEYNMAVVRGELTMGWANSGSGAFLTFGDVPARVFTNVVTSAIVRRLGLSAPEYQTLAIVTAFYYYSLFTDITDIDESELITMAARIHRITRIDPNKIMSILSGYKTLKNLQDFCDAAKAILQSPRLDNFNPLILITMMGGVWYGAAAKEIVAVSMEYPPYFMAMCYIASVDRGYNKSYLGKEVLMAGQKNNAGKDFVRAIENYIEDITHE